MLTIIQLAVLKDNYSHILHEPISGETAVIDPADAEPVLTILAAKGWKLDYVLNTHHHGDHVDGNLSLKRQTGCKIIGAKIDRHRIPGIDIEVEDGDLCRLGAENLSVIATPGHTLGHIAFYYAAGEAVFCGDTLFSLGCGRLFEGSATQMWQSLQKLKALPTNTKVYCAHEYTLANGRFALTVEPDNAKLKQRILEVEQLRRQNLSSLPSTMGLELDTNPFLREDSPAIRQAIAADAKSSPELVFSRLRELKDHFR